MIDYGKVTREAALRHGAVIRKDYAGMLPAVILNSMLESLGAAVAAALEVCRDGHAEGVRRWRKDAEAKTEGILGAALGVGSVAAAATVNREAGKAAEMARGMFDGVVLHRKLELDQLSVGMARHARLVIAAHGVLVIGAGAVWLF